MTRPSSRENRCPVCGGINLSSILEFESPEILGTSLQDRLAIIECLTCKRVFNDLTNAEYEEILRYYNEEYSEDNLSKLDSTVDCPGSMNEFTINRYRHTAKYLLNHISKDSRILDSGCAAGGFLYFLMTNGFSNLYGIDVSARYLKVAERSLYFVVLLLYLNSIYPILDSS